MRNGRLLISCILIILTFFIGKNQVSATEVETETYCRYVFTGNAHSGNAIEGIGTTVLDGVSNVTGFVCGLFDANCDFYDKNQLEHGVLANTIVDVVATSGGGIELKASKSSKLFAKFDSQLDSEKFYNGGTFTCPGAIYAHFEGYSNNDYVRLTMLTEDSSAWYNLTSWGTTYTFTKNKGPLERSIDDEELINLSDVSCSGVLGPFKKDLEGILKIIRLVAPVLVIYLGSYDYVVAVLSKDADLLKKANSRLTRRLILIAVLFFLPIVLNLVLGIIDSSYTSCIL